MTNICDGLKPKEIARYIDHTLLSPEATQQQIEVLCEEALLHGFASVCVNPCHIEKVSKMLLGSKVKACSVIGFPLGALTPRMKAAEAAAVAALGAEEIDMVISIGAVKAAEWSLVQKDISAVVQAVKGVCVKVIIEACLLTDEEKTKVCSIAKKAGAHFVKTSSGFSTGGATVGDVRLMRAAVGDNMGVKASGGIKNYASALAIIEAGATRIGTSAGIKIIAG